MNCIAPDSDITNTEEQDQQDLPYPSAQMVEQNLSEPQYQLRTNDRIDMLEHHLRGDIRNNEGDWVTKGEALMKDKGIKSMVTFVNSTVNKNTILSDFTEDQIMMLMREFHGDLAENLATNHEEYGAKIENLSIIIDIMLTFLFAGLKRAMDGGARTSITKMVNVIEKIQKDPVKKKRFGGLFGGD